MKRIVWLVAVVAVVAGSATAQAGGPSVVMGVVDRVVLGPAEKVSPRWIQFWGSFALLKANYDGYQPPVRGCLYYSVAKGHETDCRKEWDRLLAYAGKGQVVAFGHCRKPEDAGTVRLRIDKDTVPDAYPVSGIDVITNPDGDAAILALMSTPAPLKPAAAETVLPGKITLVVRNLAQERKGKVTYHFELVGSAGDKEQSPPLAAGKGETTWTPTMELRSPRYTWRVWVEEDGWKSPVASSTIIVKVKQ